MAGFRLRGMRWTSICMRLSGLRSTGVGKQSFAEEKFYKIGKESGKGRKVKQEDTSFVQRKIYYFLPFLRFQIFWVIQYTARQTNVTREAKIRFRIVCYVSCNSYNVEDSKHFFLLRRTFRALKQDRRPECLHKLTRRVETPCLEWKASSFAWIEKEMKL